MALRFQTRESQYTPSTPPACLALTDLASMLLLFAVAVERCVGGPYLELFARQRRPGW
jgi:hypothetical protein